MMNKMRIRQFTGQVDAGAAVWEKTHRRLAREAAAEGFVLLKNEAGTLPVAAGSRIGLYGAGAGFAFIGGTGSGDVNERDSVSVYEGLKAAGYMITSTGWLDDYAESFERARQTWRDDLLERTARADGDQFFDLYSQAPFHAPAGAPVDCAEAADDGADTAIYVISRIAGENADRTTEKGDYYITDAEYDQLSQLSECYQRIVLVINTGGPVDLMFTDEMPQISAILLMSQAGQEGGSALADVVSGRVSPSGKLTDTWAFHYEDYPNAATFSSRSGLDEEIYHEDIYVGYRYFDTFRVPARYLFGHGLSYTSFDVKVEKIRTEKRKSGLPCIAVDVLVTNTGDRYAGKAVVQIYAACPQSGMAKEFRRLAAFAKTGLLAPGEKQLLSVSFRADQLASYDESHSAWILGKGLYGIFAGQSLADAVIAGAVSLEDECMIRKCSKVLPLQKEIDTLKPDSQDLLAREACWHETLRSQQLPVAVLRAEDLKMMAETGVSDDIPESVNALTETLSISQMTSLVIGDPSLTQPDASSAFGQIVPGAAAQTSEIAAGDPWHIASIVLADGPAGLRLTMEYAIKNGKMVKPHPYGSVENGFFADKRPEGDVVMHQYCTAIPVGTLLAQTWDPQLIETIGRMIGEEMQMFEVSLWLAPGMNIHRNPLCGRNFEYYSEDPLISGVMAAAMTRGVQSVPGCGTTIKHFACNNQEDNRFGSDSILSERALREIYLRGFEIAVRAAQPMAMMTSYNMVNGIHAANSFDLCTAIARREWGFAGVIMSDWTTTTMSPRGVCTAAGCIAAGNDLVMPGDAKDTASITEALADGSLDISQLKACTARIIRTILKTNQYEDAVSYSLQFDDLYDWMTRTT